MRTLLETEKYYKCFASVEKLRVLNLLLTGWMIPSDIERITGIKKSSISLYLIEFWNIRLIYQDGFKKYRLYYFVDPDKREKKLAE